MLGRLRIRGKLAMVVALPLLGVALLTLPSVLGAMDRAQRAEDIGRTMQAARRVTSLVNELQQERLLSVGYLFNVVDRSQLVTQGTQVVDRIVDVREDAPASYLRSGAGGASVDAAAALTGLREEVLARQVRAERVIAEFGAVITALFDSLRLVEGVDLATPAARSTAALDASLRANEAASQTADLLLAVAATGSDRAAEQYLVARQLAAEHTAQFSRYATPDQLALVNLTRDAYAAQEEDGVRIAFGPDPREATAGRSAAGIFPSLESLRQLGRFVETKVITDVLIEVEAQARTELRTAYLVAFGALLVLLTVVLLTAVLARRVVRPLLDLTASAHRVARVADAELARIADDEAESPESVRLDPVHVDSQDEIGDLGRAFDRVQGIAVRLVERQVASRRNVALMFGYLGHRTQNLVGRQIALIDQLERNETDAGRLADLYQLDHISSRLRRNAGSLVVLSGSASAAEHIAPLPLADLARLALGEIEDYGRVDVVVSEGVAVVPAVIGDLVLILAELMENATVFSPPHTRVQVSAGLVRYGRAVEMSIIDHGIGMSPDRLAEENSRLARRERLDLAPTELLGLFVVGRLARRHGLLVTLSATPGGGVTASIQIDQRLLINTEPMPWTTATVGAERGLVPGAPARIGSTTFDVDALSRASQTLQGGHPWNAFAVPAAVPGTPPQPLPSQPEAAPEPPPEVLPGQPAAVPAPPLEAVPSQPAAAPERPPQAIPSQPTALIERPPVPSAPPAESQPGLATDPRRSGLRRRVPGASLGAAGLVRSESIPEGPATARDGGIGRRPPDPDPNLARELVEQFESGVARAQREIQDGKEHDDRE